MTKLEFLSRLQTYLTFMDIVERNQTLEFYAEQIDDRIDDGMTELQAIASLEAPEDIAANLQQMKLNVDALNTSTPPASPVVTQGPVVPSPVVASNDSRVLKTIFIVIVLLITSPIWGTILLTLIGFIIAFLCTLIGIMIANISIILSGLAVAISSTVQICTQGDGLAQLAYIGTLLASIGIILINIVLIYLIARLIGFLSRTGFKGVRHSFDRVRASRKMKKMQASKQQTAPSAPQTHAYNMTKPLVQPMPQTAVQTPVPLPCTDAPQEASILNKPLMIMERNRQIQVPHHHNASSDGQEVHHV